MVATVEDYDSIEKLGFGICARVVLRHSDPILLILTIHLYS